MNSRTIDIHLAANASGCHDIVSDLLKNRIIADLKERLMRLYLRMAEALAHEKIISHFLATSLTLSTGIPPNAFNESPRDRVRLVKINGGAAELERYFWRFLDMPIPIDPRPIHPSCVVAILNEILERDTRTSTLGTSK